MPRFLKIVLLGGTAFTGAGLLLAGVLASDARLLALGLFAWILVAVALAWGLRRLGVLVLAQQAETRGAIERSLAGIRTELRAEFRAEARKSRSRIGALEKRQQDLQRLVLRTFRSLDSGFETAQARAAERSRHLERAIKDRLDMLEASGRDLDERQREHLEAQHAESRRLVSGELSRSFKALEAQQAEARRLASTQLAQSQEALEARLEGVAGAIASEERIGGLLESSLRSAAESDAAMHLARQLFDHVKPDVVVDIAAMQGLRERTPGVTVSPLMTRFSMEPAAILALVEEVMRSRPARVLELGSGASTVWLAAALSELGQGRLVSIEHDETYYGKTRELLRANGLEAWVDLRLAPIRPCTLQDGREWSWYDLEQLQDLDGIDLLLVDGPPQSIGPLSRFPAFEQLRSRLSPGATIFVDDATRRDERRMVELWRKSDPRLSAAMKVVGRMIGLTFDAAA